MSVKRGNRVTRAQLITMLDYLAANPGLAEGRTRAMMGKKEEIKKWEEMAELLHAADGPEKTVNQWQVVWRDLKSRTNIKVKECRHRMSRGEDISSNSMFTDLELRVVDILGTEDMESTREPKREHKSSQEKRGRNLTKYEPTDDDDSYGDPLNAPNVVEEEYIEDDDYAESYIAPSKRLKPANYAAVASAIHNSSRTSNDSQSQNQQNIQTKATTTYYSEAPTKATLIDAIEYQTSGSDTTMIQANAMMIQAEAAKISAEAAKISAEAAKMNAEAAKMYASAAVSNAEALNNIADAIRLAAEAFSRRYD